jgi:hypothetical protein
MRHIKRVKFKALLLCLGLLAVVGACAGLAFSRPWRWVTVSGGYRMEKAAFNLLMERLRSDGQVAETYARYQVLFDLGYREDLIDFHDIVGFQKSLKKENLRRQEALDAGQTVFGLMQYSAPDYLDYIVSNLMLRLPERLVENGVIAASEEDLLQFYNQNKDARYRYAARATLEMLELDPSMEDIGGIIASVEDELLAGLDFKDVSARHASERGVVEMTIKEGSKMHGGFLDLYEHAIASEPGIVNGPHLLNNGIVYFRLVSHESGGVSAFEDSIFYVRKDVISHLFEQFLLKEAAKVISTMKA